MENINRNINRIMGVIRRANGNYAKLNGFGEGEMRTLHFIHHNPGVTQQEISERFDINKAATARQCASLEEKGYIYREKNDRDGRSHLLFPTEKAEEVKESHINNENEIYNHLIEDFTEEEKQELARLLEKICHKIDGDRKGGRA